MVARQPPDPHAWSSPYMILGHALIPLIADLAPARHVVALPAGGTLVLEPCDRPPFRWRAWMAEGPAAPDTVAPGLASHDAYTAFGAMVAALDEHLIVAS